MQEPPQLEEGRRPSNREIPGIVFRDLVQDPVKIGEWEVGRKKCGCQLVFEEQHDLVALLLWNSTWSPPLPGKVSTGRPLVLILVHFDQDPWARPNLYVEVVEDADQRPEAGVIRDVIRVVQALRNGIEISRTRIEISSEAPAHH